MSLSVDVDRAGSRVELWWHNHVPIDLYNDDRNWVNETEQLLGQSKQKQINVRQSNWCSVWPRNSKAILWLGVEMYVIVQ